MSFDEDSSTLYIRVTASKSDSEYICAILRGIFYANGQSNGQGIKNNQFRSGFEVQFGMPMTMMNFVESVQKYLSEEALDAITMRSA